MGALCGSAPFFVGSASRALPCQSMNRRDFYDILGVTKQASADEIRKAYRALARKFHPDVNKSGDAAKKFNEIQQAYEVLSDDAKRRKFDQYGDTGDRSPSAGGSGGSRGGGGGPVGGPGGGTYSWGNVGGPGGVRMDGFDPDELSSIFEAVMGGGGTGDDESPFGGRGQTPRPGARGNGRKPGGRAGRATHVNAVQHTHQISFDRMVQGGPETLALSEDGVRRTIELRIPKAVESGTQLRMRGVVQSSGADLVVTIGVGNHPLWTRGEGTAVGKGLDLFLNLPLSIGEATFGATVTVPTPKGRVDLSIPAKSDSGGRLRLRGQGLEDDGGRKGDLYVTMLVASLDATQLTPEQAETLKAISQATGSPRSDPEWR